MPSPVVRRNLACIGCGYDLEGLPARGNCPECGRAIVESLAERLDLETEAQAGARGSARLGWALLVAVAGAFCGTGMLATVVFRFHRVAGVIIACGGILVAWSRVYCGSHWPGDLPPSVLLGICVGLASFSIVSLLSRRFGWTGELRVDRLKSAGVPPGSSSPQP
jgi:hypothetical protein